LRTLDRPGGVIESDSVLCTLGTVLWGSETSDADAEELFKDDVEVELKDATESDCELWWVKIEPWRFNARDVDFLVFPMGSSVTGMSLSKRYGVVPNTAPSFRVERMRRARWCESRVFVVGGRRG
jgi:hypothetical protein